MSKYILARFHWLLLTLAVSLFVSSTAFGQATIVIQQGAGFNDPTPVAPVGGNNGTTLGQQRLNAFQFAASIWAATINSNVTIRIQSSWEPRPCTATGGTGGSSSSGNPFRNFPGAPLQNTWFVQALANSLAGTDLDPGAADMSAILNVNIGNPDCFANMSWYLGFDGKNPPNSIDAVAGLLHEFGHGLGFQTFTDRSSGAQFAGFPSMFDTFLFDKVIEKTWPQMTNSERAVSATPLMQPSITDDQPLRVTPPHDLTFSLLRDLGWTGVTPALPSVQLTSSTFSIGEAGTTMNVGVSRTGDTSGASTVEYTTSDAAGAHDCNLLNTLASSRCDYLTTLGKLTFAAGETSKTVSIPIVDDSYAEGGETFTITLSNVTGATLGTATATLTITDNESVNGTNPIDTTSFFVRQHYIDFLNREPDAAGLAFWSNEINVCGADPQCIEVRRINVSAAFFLSIEFQETGYLVYRTYKSGFGDINPPTVVPVPVRVLDFLRDTQQIGRGFQFGAPGSEALLEANKVAYMLAFVQRADFLGAFPNTMTAAEFVDKLNLNAGGVLSPAERTDLINGMSSPANVAQRAAVLRAVAEDSDLKNAASNKAFVLMQYFGYLRRNPNDAPDPDFRGFDFWLAKLNQFNGNFVNAEMVKAFITSIEYRQRFAP